MTKIKIIIGSTRPNRFGHQPALWLMDLSKEHPEHTYELIDLAEVNLPFLDEPQPPSAGNYVQEHTKAWSKTIDEADGFIMVTGEYNFGVMPSLKNAIDFLAKEWAHKPVAFVSYGASAGGARAVEHLKDSAGWLEMYDIKAGVIIPHYWTQLDKEGKFQPTEQQTQAAHRVLDDIGFWADKFTPIRKEIQARVQK